LDLNHLDEAPLSTLNDEVTDQYSTSTTSRSSRRRRRRRNRSRDDPVEAPDAEDLHPVDEEEGADPAVLRATRVPDEDVGNDPDVLMADVRGPNGEDIQTMVEELEDGSSHGSDDGPGVQEATVSRVRDRITLRQPARTSDDILEHSQLRRLYPNSTFELTAKATEIATAILQRPQAFEFRMLDDLDMRMRISVAVSVAVHLAATYNEMLPNQLQLFTNEIFIFFQWSTLSDMITKPHVARRIVREHQHSIPALMDEDLLCPMSYAPVMLTNHTRRALEAPTLSATLFHSVCEVYLKRTYPDFWEMIMDRIRALHMTSGQMLTLLKVDGALALWLWEESGIQVYLFNPPRISSLARVQDAIDQEWEEELESISRSI
jgi:hypothetical protein